MGSHSPHFQMKPPAEVRGIASILSIIYQPPLFRKGEQIKPKHVLDDVHLESGKLMDGRSECPDEVRCCSVCLCFPLKVALTNLWIYFSFLWLNLPRERCPLSSSSWSSSWECLRHHHRHCRHPCPNLRRQEQIKDWTVFFSTKR